MRPTLPIVALLTALAACAPVTEETATTSDTPTAEDGDAVSLGRIREEADFLSLVAGRQLIGKNGRLSVNADGTYSGTDAGLPYSGRWEWRTPVWCATSTVDATECFTWDRIPAGIRQIRQQGMGGGVDYRIQ